MAGSAVAIARLSYSTRNDAVASSRATGHGRVPRTLIPCITHAYHGSGIMTADEDGAARARTTNLLGALALEAVHAQDQATHAVVGQAGAAAAALVMIAATPGRSIEQLRGALGLSQPGATRLMDRLVQQGWIERAGATGRRGLSIRVTPAGERVLDDLLAARRAALTRLLEPLPDSDLAHLA